jgi:adenylate cyclase
MTDPNMEEELRAVLTGEHAGLGGIRNTMRRIPSSPRCKLCSAPFAGAGGAVLRHFGFARFAGNPMMCQKCIREFREHGMTGAVIPVSLVFADIRGSTGIGERLTPREFRAYLDRFYRITSDVVIAHEGLVDKFVGDEVIALFFGGVTGPRHAAAAIDAAIDMAERCASSDATSMGPIPLGTAVHTGEAYVGASSMSGGAVDDFTALGDVVNTTARLASAAAAGEVLVSVAAASAADRPIEDVARRNIEVRGRQESVDVAVLQAGIGNTLS